MQSEKYKPIILIAVSVLVALHMGYIGQYLLGQIKKLKGVFFNKYCAIVKYNLDQVDIV